MRRILQRITAGFALYGGIVLGVIVLATVVNVGGFTIDALVRPFGGSFPGLAGYEEVVQLLIGGGVLAFFPYCQLHWGHIAVDLFMERAPEPVRNAIDRLSLLATTLIALFLGVMMIEGCLESRRDGIVSSVLALPEWPFYIPGIVSVFLWFGVTAVMTVTPLGAREQAHG